MKPKNLLLRSLTNGTTFRLVVSIAPLIAAAPSALAADQLIVSGNSSINTTEVYDGYDPANPSLYTPIAPHYESDGQRDALYVYSGATLTLESGANVSVKNDDDKTAFMRVGAYGTSGSLIVENGSVLSVGQSSRYANLQIGQGAGVTGTVTQNGGQVSVRGSMNVGSNGGTGSYTVNGGVLTLDHADDVGHTSLFTIGFNNDIAASGTSSGTFNLTGGRVEMLAVRPVGEDTGSTGFIIGNRTDTALASYGGGVSGAGNGVFNQTGGVFSVGAGTGFFLSGYGNGEYNLSGGTLEIGGDSLQAKYGGGAATGTYDFNFGGGTIKVTGSDLISSVDIDVVDNDPSANTSLSTIDTNGFNATLSGNLTGDGVLVKIGEGTLTASGTNAVAAILAQGGITTNGSGVTSVGLLGVGYYGAGGSASGTYNLTAGTVNVSAAGNTGDLTVGGGAGSSGEMNISGGTLNVGDETNFGRLAVGTFGGTGVVNQSGGAVNQTGPMHIGAQGGTGTYNLSGGTLTVGVFAAAGDSNGLGVGARRAGANGPTSGTLNVSGDAQLILTDGALMVGGDTGSTAGGTGVVTQSGTSLVRISNNFLTLASGTDTATSNGTYNLNGGTLEVGGANGIQAGGGTYAFNFGGGLLKVINEDLTTSINANIVGTNTISAIDTNGLDATWAGNLTANGLLQYGQGGTGFYKIGTGELTFSGASRTLDTFGVIAGSVLQTAGNTSSVEFLVGSGAGSTGSYVMDDGSITINAANGGATAGSFRVGDFGGTGTFTQNLGTVTVTTNGALNIGNQGGNGTYNLNGGTLNLGGGLNTLGRSTGANPISSGILNIAGGALNLTNNSSLILGNNIAGAALGTGVVNQTGGTVNVGAGSALFVSGYGDGTYNLNGGTLEVGGTGLRARYNNTTSDYAFNLGGGTLKVVGSDLTAALDAHLEGANTTSVIDTNGLNAIWSGNLIADGLQQHGQGGTRLFKAGAGELTFTGATRTLDSFAVTGGQARQMTGATSSVEFMVGSGAGNTGSYVMDGGSLTINAANGGLTAGSFRVGDFGGTGTFTHNLGTVTVTTNGALNIGNQGGNGTYNLNGGTLNLGGGLNTLGRSTVGNAISSGVLNIAGGALNLTNNSKLILGNSISGAALGTGVVNQTGGVVNVGAGSTLFVSGYGNGTYNLNGGTLEVGGNGLVARYNNTTSDYAFNLGGGTVKVVGTDLTAALDAHLEGANTTSVIDTNGLNATWSGNLIADGLLQHGQGGTRLFKAGAGELTFTGATRTLDSFAVTGGQARQTTGATSSVEFMVGSGAGNTGSYVMDGGSLTINAANGGLTAGSFRVGDFGGNGTFTHNLGTITTTANSALNIGNQGGNGTYNLNGGVLTLGGGLNTLGRSTVGNPISSGVLNIAGGALNLVNNSKLILGNNISGAALGTGTVNQTGGVVNVGAGSTLFVSGYGEGTYNLNGGTLEVGGAGLKARYNNPGSDYAFNLGGGTLKVVGSDLDASLDADLIAGATSTIDTNGLNATWSGNLAAEGLHQIDHGGSKLVKAGLGTLNFTGASRVLDTFAVEGGSVNQTAGATSSVEFMVGTGSGNTASYVMAGGTLTINPSTQADNVTAVAGTFRVGDFGGTGTFTQTGGDVTVLAEGGLNIGNQGGTGTYNLDGGNLNLSGGINVLGRSAGGKPASSGTLNIGGGVMNLAGNSSLILGNNNLGQALGTGTINQTAGLVKIATGGTLFVSGYGAGSYNLNGGTLEVGGTGLRARYNNTTSSYGFNLGGGTLKVTGMDLNSDVVANLSALSNSVINTNGLNATFAGFTGTGTLTKTGLGTLTSTGIATLGGLVISEGTFRAVQTLNVGSGGITIASGAKLDANTTINAAPGTFLNVTGTLGGSGTIGIATNIQSGGTFAPGNSPGTVNIAADFVIGDGATFAWDLTANSELGAGVTFDLVTLGGAANFTMGDGSIFNVVLDGSANYADSFWQGDHSWTVVDGEGTGDVILADGVLITSNQAFNPYGTFTLGGGDNLTLNWTAVPEPSSLLFLVAFAPFVARRRRQA